MTDWQDVDVYEMLGRNDEWDAVADAFDGVAVGRSGWVRQNCFACTTALGVQDKKASLGLNTRNGVYSCFRCGLRGHLPRRWQERVGLDVDESQPDPDLPEPVEERLPPEPVGSFVPLFGRAMSLGDPHLDAIREYLTGPRTQDFRGIHCRGLRESALAEAMVGTCRSGKNKHRVVVPIPDLDGMLDRPWRGWVSRRVPDMGYLDVPYLYAKDMNREALLYNAYAMLVPTDDPVYIVEGTLDAIALWPDGVAVLGKPLESQLELMLAAERPVAVCLDGDAWEEGWALAMTLAHRGLRAVNVRLPPKTDPDEVDRALLDFVVATALERGMVSASFPCR